MKTLQDIFGRLPEGPIKEKIRKEGIGRVVKEFEFHGYRAEIRRNDSLALCGYVFLSKTHSLFGVRYLDSMFPELFVHGGVTYSEKEGNFWVIGFDCAHHDDLRPSSLCFGLEENYPTAYRDVDYVEREIKQLIKQLEAMKNENL